MPTDTPPDQADSRLPPDAVDLLLHDLGDAPVATEVSAAERAAHQAARWTQRQGGGRAVLVVDSVSIARKFISQRLRALNYDVYSAEDSAEALALAKEHRFALVFLEIALAGELDGLSLCQQIKQMRDPPGGIVPAIVFTTGDTGPSQRVRCSLAGCDAYLNKPLREDEFLAVLQDVDPLFR